MVWTQEYHTLIDKDHLGDQCPEKDCCLGLMFRQRMQKPSSESSDYEDDFRTGCWNVGHKQQSFSGLQSPRWSFSIKVILLGSNHFLGIRVLTNLKKKHPSMMAHATRPLSSMRLSCNKIRCFLLNKQVAMTYQLSLFRCFIGDKSKPFGATRLASHYFQT